MVTNIELYIKFETLSTDHEMSKEDDAMLKEDDATLKSSMDRSSAATVKEANVEEQKEEIDVTLEVQKRTMIMLSSLNI